MNGLWAFAIALSLLVDLTFHTFDSVMSCPRYGGTTVDIAPPSEDILREDNARISQLGLSRVIDVWRESKLASIRTESALIAFASVSPPPTDPKAIVVRHLVPRVQPESQNDEESRTGLAVLLSLSRWASQKTFSKPVHFVVRNENTPLSDEEKDAETLISLGTLGHYSNEPSTQHYQTPWQYLLPSRGDFLGFLSNWKGRGVANVATSLFSSTCRFETRCLKVNSTLFPFPDLMSASPRNVPTVLITDTGNYREAKSVDYETLSQITAGLETIIEGFAGNFVQPLG